MSQKRMSAKAKFASPHLRDATDDDALAIAEIYNHEVLNSVWTFDTELRRGERLADFMAAHTKAEHPLIVACIKNEVVAFGCLSMWSPRLAYSRTAEVSFFVHQNHRGRGLGRAILIDLIARARNIDHLCLIARIESNNEGSRQLLLGRDFRSVGVMHRSGVKFGRILDVEMFELLL